MNSREIKINTFRLFTFCGVTFKQISLKNNNRTLNLTEKREDLNKTSGKYY